MNDFDKKLDFDSNTFENMKHDVTMVKEFIPNYDPNIKGESREISKP